MKAGLLLYKNTICFPQFVTGSILYGIHRLFIGLFEFYKTSFVRGFFGDFLALIVCIPIFATSQKIFGLRKKNKIYLLEVIGYTILFSLYFELIGPKFNRTLTGDVLDVIAYFLGAMTLYFTNRFFGEGDI